MGHGYIELRAAGRCGRRSRSCRPGRAGPSPAARGLRQRARSAGGHQLLYSLTRDAGRRDVPGRGRPRARPRRQRPARRRPLRVDARARRARQRGRRRRGVPLRRDAIRRARRAGPLSPPTTASASSACRSPWSAPGCPSSRAGWPRRAATYAERLFAYVEVGRLQLTAPRDALVIPAEREGSPTAPMPRLILGRAERYPFFIQTYGRLAWRSHASRRSSSPTPRRTADAPAREQLDIGFHRGASMREAGSLRLPRRPSPPSGRGPSSDSRGQRPARADPAGDRRAAPAPDRRQGADLQPPARLRRTSPRRCSATGSGGRIRSIR